MKNEKEIVDILKKLFPPGKAIVGIGDDAAVFEDLVFTTDLLAEDSHFRRWHPPFFLGRKTVNINLSDIAAMGADPLFILISLSIPIELTGKWLDEFISGVKSACEDGNCSLVGGDLSHSEKIFISATAIGRTDKPVLRNRAKPGEKIVLVGDLGKARVGREALESRIKGFESLKMAFLDPVPKLKEGKEATKFASSMIDVSDGLVIDLKRLLGNLGARLYSDKLKPAKELENFCRLNNKSSLEYVLYGGEDYALLLTTPNTPPFGEVIGLVINEGMFLDDTPLEVKGFDHFS